MQVCIRVDFHLKPLIKKFAHLNSIFQSFKTSPLTNPVFTTPPLLLINLFTSSKKHEYSTNVEGCNHLKKEEVKKWTSYQVKDWLRGTNILEDTMVTNAFGTIDGETLLNLPFEEVNKKYANGSVEIAESLILKILDLKNEDEWTPNEVYLWVKNILITEIPSKKDQMIKLAKIFDKQTITGKLLLTLTEDALVKDYKMTRGAANILINHIKKRKIARGDISNEIPYRNSLKLNPSSVEEAIDHLGLTYSQVGKSNDFIFTLDNTFLTTKYWGNGEEEIARLAQKIEDLENLNYSFRGNAYFLVGGKGQGKTRALMELMKYYNTKAEIYILLLKPTI